MLYCPGEFSDSDIFTKIRKDNLNGALTEAYWRSKYFWKSKSLWPTKEYSYDPAHLSMEILDPSLTLCVLRTGVMQDANIILNRIIVRFSLFSQMVKCLSYLFLWCRGETLASSRERAKLTLLKSVKIGEDIVSGLRRSFRVMEEDGLWWVLPREFMQQGKVTQQRLILVDGRSQIGRALIKTIHTHVCGVSQEISKMYKSGVYITRHRHLFKKLQDECHMCRRLRRLNMETLMGPSHAVQASKNVPSFLVVHLDPVGPVKVDLGDGEVGKLFICSIVCIYSRFLILVPLTDMSASSIVKAVRMAGYQTANCPQILYCDAAPNLKTLMEFEDDDKENNQEGAALEKTVDNLKRILHSNGISLRPVAAKSPWKVGAVESMQKLLKTCLKRSNLYHKKLKLTDWNYILKKIESEINNRGICLSYMEDSFSFVTPKNLLFGRGKDDLPQDFDLDKRDDNLFDAVKKIDREIDQWLEIYHRSYALQIKKFFKWKQKKVLELGDVCFILDRITEAGIFTLGIVVKIVSPTTYDLEYCKKSAKVDKKTYKIIKSAKKSILTRAINQLTFICKKEECENVHIEPFNIDNVRAERGEFAHAVEDEFLGEDEIFMEDLEDKTEERVDHNLDDMIVQGDQEIVDEFMGNVENVPAVDGEPKVEESLENDKEANVTEAPVGDIVDIGDEVTVDKPQESNQIEEITREPIMVKYVGDTETMRIDDNLINPRAQGGSRRGRGRGRGRRRKNW